MFYRDSTVSSTDAIMAVLGSSLELLLLHPLTSAWNTDMVLADKAEEEMTDNAISDAISPYEHRDIDSNVAKWIPNAAMILTGAAVPQTTSSTTLVTVASLMCAPPAAFA